MYVNMLSCIEICFQFNQAIHTNISITCVCPGQRTNPAQPTAPSIKTILHKIFLNPNVKNLVICEDLVTMTTT